MPLCEVLPNVKTHVKHLQLPEHAKERTRATTLMAPRVLSAAVIAEVAAILIDEKDYPLMPISESHRNSHIPIFLRQVHRQVV